MKLEQFISIYAAFIIASIALIWNIIKYFKQNKGKLKVNAFIKIEPKEKYTLKIEIINKGKSLSRIYKPSLVFKNANPLFYALYSFNDNKKYPVEIKPLGGTFSTYMPIDSLYKGIINENENENENVNIKFRVFIENTLNKKYKSEWLSFDDKISVISHKNFSSF